MQGGGGGAGSTIMGESWMVNNTGQVRRIEGSCLCVSACKVVALIAFILSHAVEALEDMGDKGWWPFWLVRQASYGCPDAACVGRWQKHRMARKWTSFDGNGKENQKSRCSEGDENKTMIETKQRAQTQQTQTPKAGSWQQSPSKQMRGGKLEAGHWLVWAYGEATLAWC